MKTRAFTLIELLVVLAIIGVLIGVSVPSLGRSRISARQLKDAVQLRSIHLSMVAWAGQHQDWYPLPSKVDRSDTIPGIDSTPRPCGVPQQDAELKNLPRWIVSLMLFNGLIQTETCISPGEVNARFEVNRVFEFENPSAVGAPKRSMAVLDPAFAAYPYEDGGDLPIASSLPFPPVAGFSYAISPPVGRLLEEWKSTAGSGRCVLGNRGPWYRRGDQGGWVLDPSETRGQSEISAKDSNTLRFWGRRTDWAGNVVRNDSSVTFETRPDPQNLRMSRLESPTGAFTAPDSTDNLFVLEAESPDADPLWSNEINRLWRWKNNFLRCYGGNSDSWRNIGEGCGPHVPSRIWFD